MSNFKIIQKDAKARAGVLTTAHGDIDTPIFMPVGTQGTVKALDPQDLSNCGAQVILGNTYHLYLRPGHKLINKLGGLHQFMGWDGPILTDSGGFQAFSLGAMIEHGIGKIGRNEVRSKKYDLRIKNKGSNEEGELFMNRKFSFLNQNRVPVTKITEEGVHFVSHLDGAKHLLSPELSMEVQLALGSDIMLVLDELLSPMHDRKYARESLERTHRWELRSKQYFDSNIGNSINPKAQLFGILQGVYDKEIRETEARWIASQDFAGVSIGGSFGTSEYYKGGIQCHSGDPERSRRRRQNQDIRRIPDEAGMTETDIVKTAWIANVAINETMDWVVPLLPDEWPKHALGVGEVVNIFECVERGIDMFDCVAPTRRARNGSLYISPKSGGKIGNTFTLSIANAAFRGDKQPIDPQCSCYTCQKFSRAYLRHLFMAKELLFYRLASIHNVHFMVNLTTSIRNAVLEKRFIALKKTWLN